MTEPRTSGWSWAAIILLWLLVIAALAGPCSLHAQRIAPDQIAPCAEGEIIKTVSGVMACAADSGAGGGAPTDAQYWVGAADVTLTAEIVVTNESTLESALGAINLIVSTEIDSESELEALLAGVSDIFTSNDGALADDDLSDDLITGLSDVSAKSGTGSTVLFQGSPSITTPTIADFSNSTHAHANAAGGGQIDIDALSGQSAWGTAATKDTADLIISGVEVDFESGSSEGYPRIAQSTTPPAAACDAAGEAGRLYFDTDLDTDGSVMICRGAAGWKDIDDDGAAGGNTFETWDAPAGTDPVADSSADTMTLAVSAQMSITGDSSADSLTFDVVDTAAFALSNTSNTFRGASFTSAAADPADSGVLRLGNTQCLGWEVNPTGTDLTLCLNSANALETTAAFRATGLMRVLGSGDTHFFMNLQGQTAFEYEVSSGGGRVLGFNRYNSSSVYQETPLALNLDTGVFTFTDAPVFTAFASAGVLLNAAGGVVSSTAALSAVETNLGAINIIQATEIDSLTKLNTLTGATIEEEAHEAEHRENAADELLAENLGTACSDGQLIAASGGGMDCASLPGASYDILNYKSDGDTTGGVWLAPYRLEAVNDLYSPKRWIFTGEGTTDACLHFEFTVMPGYDSSGTTQFQWHYTGSADAGSENAQVYINYRAVGGTDTESMDQASYQESISAVAAPAPSAADEKMIATLDTVEANFASGDTVSGIACRDLSDAADDWDDAGDGGRIEGRLITDKILFEHGVAY